VTSRRWRRPGAGLPLVAAVLLTIVLPTLHPWRLRDGPPTGPSARAPATAHGSPAGKPNRPRARVPAASATVRTPTAGPLRAAADDVAAGRADVESTVEPSGRWRCGLAYRVDAGRPVLAQPCYTTGGTVRIVGRLRAYPQARADVSVSLQDAATGTTVAGPYTCAPVVFTDAESSQDCGPYTVDPPHGHRYVVVETWRCTGAATARGPEFTW